MNDLRDQPEKGTPLKLGPKSRCRRIGLSFGNSIGEIVRRRIQYAFQVFCAVHDYEFVEISDSQVVISYGECNPGENSLRNPVGFSVRSLVESATAPSFVSCLGVSFPRFHAPDGIEIDWLGEVFEWISSAHELSVRERDPAGRIPYAQTLHGKFQLDPTIPYASVAMASLDIAIQKTFLRDSSSSFRLGIGDQGYTKNCTIVATHDVDFLPVSRLGSLKRLAKNLLISLIAYRDLSLAKTILLSVVKQKNGRLNPLDCLPYVLNRERELGIESTYNILCDQHHRRDGNYLLEDAVTLAYLNEIEMNGMEVAVHGSYSSLSKPGGIVSEYERLKESGYSPLGGRQHWLRYVDSTLFRELCRAGAIYDCSVGYSESIGFRTGAAFSYPPYNFAEEAPFPLLEIPLVAMDSAIYCESRVNNDWKDSIDRVLNSIRKYGRTGVSILWHDTVFAGGQLPLDIADMYWEWKKDGDTWESALKFVRRVWSQYERAGLFPIEVMANAA